MSFLRHVSGILISNYGYKLQEKENWETVDKQTIQQGCLKITRVHVMDHRLYTQRVESRVVVALGYFFGRWIIHFVTYLESREKVNELSLCRTLKDLQLIVAVSTSQLPFNYLGKSVPRPSRSANDHINFRSIAHDDRWRRSKVVRL